MQVSRTATFEEIGKIKINDFNKPLGKGEFDKLLDNLEIDDIVQQAKAQPNKLHRFLFIYKEKLTIEFVCNNILKDHLYHPKHRNLRRVIIFLDSKSQATKYIRHLNKLKRTNAWPDNYKVYVTPYHGDCPSMNRRMYEKMMNKYVKEN